MFGTPLHPMPVPVYARARFIHLCHPGLIGFLYHVPGHDRFIFLYTFHQFATMAPINSEHATRRKGFNMFLDYVSVLVAHFTSSVVVFAPVVVAVAVVAEFIRFKSAK